MQISNMQVKFRLFSFIQAGHILGRLYTGNKQFSSQSFVVGKYGSVLISVQHIKKHTDLIIFFIHFSIHLYVFF